MTAEIMIVDDFKEWRLRLRSFLELIPGFRVVCEAADGLEAVEKAAQWLPDIVLLDIGLPLLNGIEAAPRIRRASPLSRIIFLTQEHDSDIRAAALASGAAAYLSKSTPVSELRHTIEESLLNGFQACDAAMRIPTQLNLPGLDNPSRQEFSARRRGSQTVQSASQTD